MEDSLKPGSLVREELKHLPRDKREGTFLLGSVIDPYQGPERRYLLTRGILTVLAEERYRGIVRILAKSPLVVRDIDLLTRLPRADVGMTVTTTDDKISRWLEVRAPRSSHRLKALAAPHEAGIPTFAFAGPPPPHFAERPDLLDQLFGRLANVGVREVHIEHINLKQYIRERMNVVLAKEEPQVREAYVRARQSASRDTRRNLRETIGQAWPEASLRRNHLPRRVPGQARKVSAAATVPSSPSEAGRTRAPQ